VASPALRKGETKTHHSLFLFRYPSTLLVILRTQKLHLLIEAFLFIRATGGSRGLTIVSVEGALGHCDLGEKGESGQGTRC